MHNNLRDEKVSEFETTLANIRFIGVKSFLEQFPEEKEPLSQFKKDVEVYKYASDEHIHTHHDKALGEIKLERRDAIATDLEKRDFTLRSKIAVALRKKRIADEDAQRKKDAEKQQKRAEKNAEQVAQLLVENGTIKPEEKEEKIKELLLKRKYGFETGMVF